MRNLLPLVEIGEEMGAMYFSSGSHRLGNLGDFPIGEPSEAAFARLVADHGLRRVSHAPFAAGDATFHSGWTLHGAPPNRSDTMREVMTMIYYADGARIGPLDHPARQMDCALWLDNGALGEVAAGPLNPVLYRRSDVGDATR